MILLAIFGTILFLKTVSSQVCSSSPVRIEQSQGVLTSPNYPGNYPSRATCRWILALPAGNSRLRIHFKDFITETSSTCGYDRLILRDGPSSSSPLIGTFCGATRPPNIFASGREVYAEFLTDSSNTYRGFRLVFDGVAPAQSVASAFHVRRTSDFGPNSDPATVTYDYIVLNEGNHFDRDAGHYRAPVRGIYAISWKVATDGPAPGVIDVRCESRTIEQGSTFGPGPVSNTIVVLLNARDQCYLVLQPASVIKGGYTSMSGYLLSQTA